MSTINPKRQHGFAMVAAIFILVILAGLSLGIVSLGTSQQLESAQDIGGMKALQAARTGIDWGLYQLLKAPAGAYANICTTAGSNSQTLTSTPGLTEYSIVVNCTKHQGESGACAINTTTPCLFQISVTACNSTPCPNTTNPNSLYIERRMDTTLEF